MKSYFVGSAAIIALIGVNSADAADLVKAVAASSSQHNWNGFYVGVTAGAAWGQYDPVTSTVSAGYLNSVDTAAVNAMGRQSIKANGFVAGIEGGYNWRVGNLLFGVEADLQAVHLNGATSSGVTPYNGAPGTFFTVTSYGNTNWLLTARPRIGFVTPDNWLVYATGGLALTKLQSDFSFVDSSGAFESGQVSTIKAGYAVGGGVEAPLTDRLSLKADYLHVEFANAQGAMTANNLIPAFPGQVFAHSSDLKADIVRAGLNYRLGGADAKVPGTNTKALVWKAPPLVNVSKWKVETGARLWFSTGSIGAPNPLIDVPDPFLASRLVFGGLDAISAETFARADHASGFFVKGNLGAGRINNGQLNDTDYLGFAGILPFKDTDNLAFSNTQSSAAGQIGYVTVDLGYNFLTAPGAKVGAFVGYNYYAQGVNAYGCTQLAGAPICVPTLQPNLLVLTENNHYHSLRVGLSSEVMLSDRTRLTTEVAYVPWLSYGGLDNHLLRQLLDPESASGGDGVMLEAILDYRITDAWNIGVGGRYWAWNTNTGTFIFNNLTAPPPSSQTARFTTERYGMFVQTSYRWGDRTPAAAKASVMAAGPMDWTGFYVGGHMGGGWSDAQWSDPFGSSLSNFGIFSAVNVAGFGDTTHATGPLGGGQIGANWQTGPWVLGVQADASAANMRGENTCFSGLGGLNCQHTVNALGTVTGRVGYAWNRSLAYVKGGGAWADTTYELFGNHVVAPFFLCPGQRQHQFADLGMRTLGGGIEYALTDHWTVLAEYDHIGLPSRTVPFPTVPVISSQTISVKQTVDIVKLGMNYKFEFASLGAIGAKN